MDTRTQDSASSKPDKKRHIQRIRSPSHYHGVYRPRFERKNIRSRFRFFRTMEERFFQRPHAHAWWNQRPRAAQWWSLQLKPRAASLSRLENSSIKHVKPTTAEIPVPSSGERPPLSFKVLQKANKKDSGSSATRKRAIQKKQEQIEEVYRQDCDTFGMVVKMLVSKDPSLEKPIQLSLRENLRDIGARCIQAMEQFIQEYDSRERDAPSASRQPSIS